jgi:hypothetical protein
MEEERLHHTSKIHGVYRTRRQSVGSGAADFGKKIDSGSAR